MSRPSKLTRERQEKIASLIRAGNYSSQAAQASGISERTFFRWMEQGEKAAEKCEEWKEATERWNELNDAERLKNPELSPNPQEEPSNEEVQFFQFWQTIKKAEAEAEAALVLQVRQAANDGTWQAASWLLERGRTRERWTRQDRTIHEGTVAHNHQLLPTSPEAIEAGRKRLEAAREEQKKLQPVEEPIDAEVVEE